MIKSIVIKIDTTRTPHRLCYTVDGVQQNPIKSVIPPVEFLKSLRTFYGIYFCLDFVFVRIQSFDKHYDDLEMTIREYAQKFGNEWI